MEKLVFGDKTLVRAIGVGLKLLDFPYVKSHEHGSKLSRSLAAQAGWGEAGGSRDAHCPGSNHGFRPRSKPDVLGRLACVTAGHGPGGTSLLTTASGKITPQTSAEANIASLLKLRADI